MKHLNDRDKDITCLLLVKICPAPICSSPQQCSTTDYLCFERDIPFTMKRLSEGVYSIPDICHLGHLHVGGEEICHVEKFQISIHGISPHEEEFQFFHTTDVEKCEFLPNLVKFHISPQDRCEEI